LRWVAFAHAPGSMPVLASAIGTFQNDPIALAQPVDLNLYICGWNVLILITAQFASFKFMIGKNCVA
jgi:hypothetical protein